MVDVDLFRAIAVAVIPVLFAITIHEVAHGYVARHFGDMTAASLGRLTLNPLAHIDLVGTVALPLILLIMTNGEFAFGYAKPVPVNMMKLRNPKQDMMWVALAGPVSNWVQAFIWAILLVIMLLVGFHEPFFFQMAKIGIVVNLVLCMLNLFPLLPLDGGRILYALLPHNAANAYARLERFGFLIVIVLLYLGVISNYWIRPLVKLGYSVIQALVFAPFGLLV